MPPLAELENESTGIPLILTKQEKQATLKLFNIAFITLNMIFVIFLAIACSTVHPYHRGIWFLLVVAIAGSGAGNVVGFIYASYGKETERFTPITNLINGFIGGASLADLSHGQSSILVAGFRSLAKSCGLESGGPMVAIVVAAFASLGFISMYCNRKLIINSLMAEQERLTEGAVDIASAARINAPGSAPGPETPGAVSTGTGGTGVADRPSLPAAAKSAANEVGKMAFSALKSQKDRIAWAKAKLDQEQYEDAVLGFSAALEESPADPELLLGKGLSLFYSDNAADRSKAIPTLVSALGAVVSGTDKELVRTIYKSLTYCCLYQPGGYKDAIKWGEKFLGDPTLRPSSGILANLAAAFGQEYADLLAGTPDIDPSLTREARSKSLNYMKKAIQMDRSWIPTFRMLMVHNYPRKSPNENDLECFEHDPEFRATVGLPVESQKGMQARRRSTKGSS